jgi:chitinase
MTSSESQVDQAVQDAADSLDTGVVTDGLDTIMNVVPVGDTIAPSVVNAVIASADSTSEITIMWIVSNDSGLGLAGYKIYRNGTLAGITQETHFTDDGLDAGSENCYSVVAFDKAGNAASPSAPSCAVTPGSDEVPPLAPDGVAASADSATQVTVRWNASADIGGSGVKGYRVFRNGIYCRQTATTSFTDTVLAPNSQYCYTVDAFDYEFNRSAASAEVCVTTPMSSGAAPSGPSNLAVTGVGAAYVTLEWDDNSGNELGFQIERASSADGPWVLAGTTSSLWFTDVSVVPSTTYYYRVSAFN